LVYVDKQKLKKKLNFKLKSKEKISNILGLNEEKYHNFILINRQTKMYVNCIKDTHNIKSASSL